MLTPQARQPPLPRPWPSPCPGSASLPAAGTLVLRLLRFCLSLSPFMPRPFPSRPSQLLLMPSAAPAAGLRAAATAPPSHRRPAPTPPSAHARTAAPHRHAAEIRRPVLPPQRAPDPAKLRPAAPSLSPATAGIHPHHRHASIPAKNRPKSPQEFFGKNSYCARGPLAAAARPASASLI